MENSGILLRPAAHFFLSPNAFRAKKEAKKGDPPAIMKAFGTACRRVSSTLNFIGTNLPAGRYNLAPQHVRRNEARGILLGVCVERCEYVLG